MVNLQSWQHQYQCALCKTIIYSKVQGSFESCTCRAIAVDQTKWYERRIGEPENFLNVETKDE